MGPAEIVASLKELCAEKGPRLTTEEIVAWIERIGGFEIEGRADRLCQEDEGPAVRPDARSSRTRTPACGSSGSGASTTGCGDGGSMPTSSRCPRSSGSD